MTITAPLIPNGVPGVKWIFSTPAASFCNREVVAANMKFYAGI